MCAWPSCLEAPFSTCDVFRSPHEILAVFCPTRLQDNGRKRNNLPLTCAAKTPFKTLPLLLTGDEVSTATMAAPKMELDPKYDHYDYPTTSPSKQNGHPGHTTPEENAKVHQLRTELERAGCKDRLDTLTMVLSYPSFYERRIRLTPHSYGSYGHGNSTCRLPKRCMLLPSLQIETAG